MKLTHEVVRNSDSENRDLFSSIPVVPVKYLVLKIHFIFTSAASCSQWQVSQSMSGAGNCFDNAVAESFFASLKKERLHMVFATRTEAYDAVERYIDGFYNPTRRHSLLGYVSPLAYEKQAGAVAA